MTIVNKNNPHPPVTAVDEAGSTIATLTDTGIAITDIMSELAKQPVREDADGNPTRQILLIKEVWNTKSNRKRARDKIAKIDGIPYISADSEEDGDLSDEKLTYRVTLTQRIVTAEQRATDATAAAKRKADAAAAEAQRIADQAAREAEAKSADEARLQRIEEMNAGALSVAEAEATAGNRIDIALTVDAYGHGDRFAVLATRRHHPLWYGCAFNGGLEQSAAEMDAAKKAVWLAAKIGDWLTDKLGKKVRVRLTLQTDAQWLTLANGNGRNDDGSRYGGKARALSATADKYGVDLIVKHIAGDDNPADAYTRCRDRSYKKWDSSDMREALVI